MSGKLTQNSLSPEEVLLGYLGRFCAHEIIVSAVSSLRKRMIDCLKSSIEKLEGEDDTGYVVDSNKIRLFLQHASDNLHTVSVDHISGAVSIMQDNYHLRVGTIYVPFGSDLSQLSFTNTMLLHPAITCFVFTRFQCFSSVQPSSIASEEFSDGSFCLSDREAIAAQILMLVSACMASGGILNAISAEMSEIGVECASDKLAVNKAALCEFLACLDRLKDELLRMPTAEERGSEALRLSRHEP